MSYHVNPAINDAMLSIINDGDGSQCGMTYHARCEAADYGIWQFRNAVKAYSERRLSQYGLRKLKHKEIIEAARLIQNYYREHNAEVETKSA